MNKKIMLIIGLISMKIFAQEEKNVSTASTQTFWDIVKGGEEINYVSLFIWILLFICSIMVISMLINQFLTLKEKNIIPEDLVEEVNELMEEGKLELLIEVCEESSSSLGQVLATGFSNLDKQYEVLEEAIGNSFELEAEKLLQKVKYIDVLGQVAPMLGLLGTVTGMISAFSNLANAGANKEQLLALSISGALWTTTAGLLIALPAIGGFTIMKNKLNNILIELNIIVTEVFKKIRD